MKFQQSEDDKAKRIRYDRARFLGRQTQFKLFQSMIYLHGSNGILTQLAKNLILSGVNITICDSHRVDDTDIETNFLLSSSDKGQLRGKIICQRLKEINQLTKIQFIEQSQNVNFQNYNIITTSITDFDQLDRFFQLAYNLNKPYYNLCCNGLYGYALCFVGRQFHYNIKRNQQVSQHVNKGKSRQQYFQRIEIKNPLFTAIQCLRKGHQNKVTINAYENTETLIPKVNQVVQYAKQFDETINQQELQLIKKFVRYNGLQFCPVYSIIGSIISQEYIKIISKINEPGVGWLLYNSEEGTAVINRIWQQNNKQNNNKEEVVQQ